MSAHECESLKPPGECYRCDLNRDEMHDSLSWYMKWKMRFNTWILAKASGMPYEKMKKIVGTP